MPGGLGSRKRSCLFSCLGSCLVVIIAVSGCRLQSTAGTRATPAPTGNSPAVAPGAPPSPALAQFYAAPARWAACTKASAAIDETDLTGYQCADVVVPLDYQKPQGRTISIRVARSKASGPNRIGSLLLNPGGPGESGLGYLAYQVQTFPAAIRSRFDLVEFDPRGIGASAGLHCLPATALDRTLNQPVPAGPSAFAAAQTDAAQLRDGCVRTAGWELPYLGTTEAARDLDIIRSAVGDTSMTFYGGSYGSMLGAVYAQNFPGRIRALVLDGAVPPGLDVVTMAHQQAVALDQQLMSYLTDCTSRGTCPWSGTASAARTQVEALMLRIERKPLHTSLGRPLQESAALSGLMYGLYYTSFWDQLSVALTNAVYGDGSGLLGFADQVNGRDEADYSSLVSANPAVLCADVGTQVSSTRAAAYAKQWVSEAPLFAGLEAAGLITCDGWMRSAAPIPARVDAAGAPTILVVGNTGDPVTPYAWARDLAGQLSSARLLTFVGNGHTIYANGSSCIDAAVDSYLIDLTPPPAGTRCTSTT